MAKRILIIEDDKFLRDLVRQKLESEGFETVDAVDGEEGIRKVKEEKLDLVLLDLVLPKISGLEVLAKIKEDPAVSSIPVIILSNIVQDEKVGKGLELGAVDYLIKAHFTLGEIVERIKKFLK